MSQVDCRRHARTWEGMIHKALEHAASAGKHGAKASRRESLDPKITLSVDRVDNVQLNRAFTAENVARMIINRGRSGTESLRKGDLLRLMADLSISPKRKAENDRLYKMFCKATKQLCNDLGIDYEQVKKDRQELANRSAYGAYGFGC